MRANSSVEYTKLPARGTNEDMDGKIDGLHTGLNQGEIGRHTAHIEPCTQLNPSSPVAWAIWTASSVSAHNSKRNGFFISPRSSDTAMHRDSPELPVSRQFREPRNSSAVS